jgi:hypothetical protein
LLELAPLRTTSKFIINQPNLNWLTIAKSLLSTSPCI